MPINNAVNASLVGVTGTGNFVGSNSPTITTPRINSLYSSNGMRVLDFVGAASSVNYIAINSSATGAPVGIGASGSDAKVPLALASKGGVPLYLYGGNDGSAIPPGYVGEIKQINVPGSSAVSITFNTAVNVASLTLTPGIWATNANAFIFNASFTNQRAWINNVSATEPDVSFQASKTEASSGGGIVVPTRYYNVTSNTTIYLSVITAGTGGPGKVCGTLNAQRIA